MKIILVSVGIFQNYIIENINQLLFFNYDIIVITEKKFFDKLNIFPQITKIDSQTISIDFDRHSNYSKTFRNGFWHNCSKRLFLVHGYMKQYNIENCIHLENDVLLYTDFRNFNFDKNKVYLTMDSKERCIASIMYIPNYKLIDNLINNYNFQKDDMTNLAMYYYKNNNVCYTFPIIKNNTKYPFSNILNKHFNEFNSIFDAAAIGQYLGGVDPENQEGSSIGFINETCLVKYNFYKFKWIKKDNNYFPHILTDNELIPINNLHIHSKNLKKFTINNPIQNQFIQIE